MFGRRFSAALVLGSMVLGTLGTQSVAAASTRWVNDDDPNGGTYSAPGTSCNNPGYATIQSAVNAAGPGDRIAVCPGSYPEIVVVSGPTKNNIQLYSTSTWAAVISAPPTIALDLVNNKSIVRITDSRNVVLRGFRITGPGPGPCDSIRYGVRLDTNASAVILGNHITKIRDEPFSGCQNGIAILVGRASEGAVAQAAIGGNKIDDYQKGGIVVSNAGSKAAIELNSIKGFGPTATIAQNGVQVSAGATAHVGHNSITDNAYSPLTVVSTGVLLFSAGDTTVTGNLLARNDESVYAIDVVGPTISNNRTFDNTFDGIGLSGTTQAKVSRNHSSDNGYDGIWVGSDSTDNRISKNKLRDNAEHDCHDDSVGAGTAGTANIWTHNDGSTENRPGLCVGTGDDDDHHDHDGMSGKGKSVRTVRVSPQASR